MSVTKTVLVTEAGQDNPHKTREVLTDKERARFEEYAAEIFSRMGLNLNWPGGRDTPRRWVTALWDMTEGYDGDPKLNSVFPDECPRCPDEDREHILEGPIEFTGLCEHHTSPIRGSAWVGYLASERLIGLSKLTRIVRLYSKRFTSQERLSNDIANELGSIVQPRGVAVFIEAEHLCTQARGVRDLGSRTRTIIMRGAYDQDTRFSQEFWHMIEQRGNSTRIGA